MIHYIYRITNKHNGQEYTGRRSTKKASAEEDNYFGSGVWLRAAVKKYGRETFTFEVLQYCDTYEELVETERFIVNEEYVARSDTYNLALGGGGGIARSGSLNHYYGKKHSPEVRAKMSAKAKLRPNNGWNLPKGPLSEERKLKQSLTSARARPIIIDGVYYYCHKEVERAFNFKPGCFWPSRLTKIGHVITYPDDHSTP